MKTYSNDFYKKAANLIAEFEGFASKAYWDVNAYRIGYGSDTITLSTSGEFRKVVQGDVTTKELATIDLARRVPEYFKNGVVKRIGSEYTDKFPESVLIALTSFAYNYGSVKKSVVEGAKTLDIKKLADAVRAAQDDNGGINKKRRNKEADIIQNSPPPSSPPSIPPQNKILGKVVDEKGNPVPGVEVQIGPPKQIILSPPIKNPNTGKFEVKDQDGNVIADSTDKEVARKQASDIILNKNRQQSIDKPQPPAPTASTLQGYPDTPFKNSIESDDFRKWLLNKYPSYGTRTDKYKVDPPPQPNYINTDALKKAWSERGTEYNIANTKFTSVENMEPTEVEEPVIVVTDKNGNWEMTTPTTFDPKSSTIVFSKKDYEIREITNLQQTSGDITGEEGKQYDVSRITLPETPDITASATNQLNQEIITEETKLIKQQGNSELSAQERLANKANFSKEELKKTAIPFIIKLLIPFGAVALQAILSRIPLDKVKNQIQCPSQAKLLELINKRNKLVKQINNAYKTINILSKTLSITNTAISAIQAGITAIEILPYPSIGVPPVLPPLTSGIIELTGSGKDKLKESLKKANVVISIVTLALAAFGAILGILLRLLNNLDALIQQCSEEQELPFETINNELNVFVNESTGVSNSEVIADDNTYKGFILELKLDETNSIKYPRRFAQALNKQKVPVLKTDSSFASDPQVLLDQLRFIIDSNPQLTAE